MSAPWEDEPRHLLRLVVPRLSVQQRLATIGRGVDVGALAGQPFRHLPRLRQHRQMERRPAIVVFCVDFGAVGEERFRRLARVERRRPVKRCLPPAVSSVDVGPLSDQPLDRLEVVRHRCMVQRRGFTPGSGSRRNDDRQQPQQHACPAGGLHRETARHGAAPPVPARRARAAMPPEPVTRARSGSRLCDRHVSSMWTGPSLITIREEHSNRRRGNSPEDIGSPRAALAGCKK